MLMTIVVKLMTTRNNNNKRDNRAGTNINKSGSIQNRKAAFFYGYCRPEDDEARRRSSQRGAYLKDHGT